MEEVARCLLTQPEKGGEGERKTTEGKMLVKKAEYHPLLSTEAGGLGLSKVLVTLSG